MHGIYTYIPKTNHVPREYSVAAILSLLYGMTNRCNNVQCDLFLCKSTLHVSGGTHAHHQEYRSNCIYSHW